MQQLNSFITIKQLLRLIPKLESVPKLAEPAFWLPTADASPDITTIDNEENLDITDKLDVYLRS